MVVAARARRPRGAEFLPWPAKFLEPGFAAGERTATESGKSGGLNLENIHPVTDRTRRRRSTLGLALLLALPFLAAWQSLFAGWLFDDAYIAFRFADHWAQGMGLTWNSGEDPVEGFTSIAWVALAALGRRVTDVPPVQAFLAFGALAWLATIVLVARLAEKVAPGALAASMLALVAVVANPYLGFQIFHGLETPLQAASFAALAYFALQPAGPSDPGLKTGLAGLAATSVVAFAVRPDALALAVPLWAARFAFGEPGRERRRIAFAFLATGGAWAALTAAKWLYFGHPLPNTFYIKQGGLLSGLPYVKAFALVLSPLALFACYAWGHAGWRRLARDRVFVTLALPAVLFCAAYLKLNPIMGRGYRFLIATLPLFVLAGLRLFYLVTGADAAVEGPRRSEKAWVFRAAMVALILLFGVGMAGEYRGMQRYFASVRETLVPAGQALARAAELSPPPLLATGDVGAIPYFSRLPTLDLIGLTDEHIAHRGLTHAYLDARRPDLFILQNLYLQAPAAEADRASAPGVVFEIAGRRRHLDLERYAGVRAAPEKAHHGTGSTYQVVTWPGFAERYTHVAAWNLGGRDLYHVFVRRDYPRREPLERQILAAALPE